MGKHTKETLVMIAILAGLAGCAVGFLYLPQKRQLTQIRTDIAAQKAHLEMEGAKANVVPTMVRQVEEMKARYRDFDQKLPKSRELFGFLKQIGQNLAEANLSSQSIEPGTPIREELFHTLPIIMKFCGRYSELTRFLSDIDKMERLSRVQKLQIQSNRKDSNLGIVVHMNIYFTER
ncbi:MAG TPA: type 4a pilus biogenesis protein PilO [Phycisphaerae bacterium]|nr:type 4a pilus biogenesis protein PilO [Phycisphaerae bacterium]